MLKKKKKKKKKNIILYFTIILPRRHPSALKLIIIKINKSSGYLTPHH